MGSNKELTEAIKNNDLESIKGWVEQGANLRAGDDWVLRLAALNSRLEVVKYLLERGADSNLITERMLVRLFTSYDLQIATNTPRLISLLLKIDLVKKSYQIRMRNKTLSTYKKRVLSPLGILMYHLYYRPSGPGFFQAIGQI